MKRFIASVAFSCGVLFAHPSAVADQLLYTKAELTAYCPCVKCCGDFKGKVRGVTASGTQAAQGRTLAAPKGIPFGTEVYLLGSDSGQKTPLGIVEDRGGAIKAKADGSLRFDVFFASHEAALQFGRKHVEVLLVNRGSK